MLTNPFTGKTTTSSGVSMNGANSSTGKGQTDTTKIGDSEELSKNKAQQDQNNSWGIWDNIQTGLDVVGMIPIIGEVADFASAGISVARGDYAGAALSMAAMVPFVGNAAGAAKLIRTANNVIRRSGAQKLADKVQNLSAAQRPNTVAVIKHKDGTITVGRNQGGVENSTVNDALNRAPQNCFAGQCAEVNAISRALNKGRSLDGAQISISNVRGSASMTKVHGTPKAPCTTCSNVLDQFGIKLNQ
jgi:hypothetical protein